MKKQISYSYDSFGKENVKFWDLRFNL